MHLDATVDLRPIGSVDLTGLRVGDDFRWLAYVAADRQLGQYGVGADRRLAPGTSRPGTTGSAPTRRRPPVDRSTCRRSRSPCRPAYRATAEDRGIEVIEGARARRCRIAVDGATFAAAFPAGRPCWSGPADLHRWRGQLDYWIFLDGELGQVAGSANGEAAGIVPEALNGTIDVRLTATERGRDAVVYPPTP